MTLGRLMTHKGCPGEGRRDFQRRIRGRHDDYDGPLETCFRCLNAANLDLGS